MRNILILLAGLVWLPGPAGSDPAPRIPPGLAQRAALQGEVRVLVELAVPFAPEGELAPGQAARQRSEIASARSAVVGALRGTPHRLRRAFATVPFVALEVGPRALAALERSPFVSRVDEDALASFSLDGTVPLIGAQAVIDAGYDGTGQVVVVLDTGVDGAHPNLAGKLVDEACFASLGPGPNGDCPNGSDTQFGPGAGIYCSYSSTCDHGTHVAGIAVGSGPQSSGVAQGAGLISIQVASEITDPGSCSPLPAPCPQSLVSDQIAALEHVYTTMRLAHDVASINVSLSGGAWTSQASCDLANAATKAAIDNLRSVGIGTAIAAGNDGLTDAIGAPACISSAISVGATFDSDVAWSISNAASFLSLWAPGVSIRAPRWQTTGYVNKSGTSMAAPHVAGALAILRQADAAASVSTLVGTLQQTGVPIAHATATTTRIDVLAAVEALTVDCDDGLDNDGDGFVDHAADPGCDDASDDSERSDALVCDDGEDNDGDGLVDHTVDGDGDGVSDPPGDPACASPLSGYEARQCQDGIDNDSDNRIDWDGGVSIWGEGHPNVTDPDPQCNLPWRNNERATPRCGLGAELVLLLVPGAWGVRRRWTRRATRARSSLRG